MRRKVLLVITLALVAVALFLLGASGSKTPDTDPTGDNTTSTQPTLTIEQQIAAQRRAVDASAAVDYLFRYQGWTGSAKPEYYGGMYIEDNKLYVQVNPAYTKEVELFKASLTGYRDVIVFEETQYSYTTRYLYTNYLASVLIESGYRVTGYGPSSGSDYEGHIEVLKEDLEAATAKAERIQKQVWGDITPPRVPIVEGEYSRLD